MKNAFIIVFLIALFGFQTVQAQLIPFREGKKFGYVDLEGNVVVKPTLERTFPFKEGLGRFKYKGYFGYMNPKGQVVINNVYKSAWDFNEGLAKICEGTRCSFINPQGIEVFKVIGAEEVGEFSDGVCVFKKLNRYGYFDKTGKIIVEPHFTKAENFTNGYARVNSDAKQGLLRKDGTFVLFPIYDYIGVPHHNRVRVRVGGHWHIYDTNGKRLNQIKHMIYTDFEDGAAVIYERLPSRISWYGYIDKDGKELIKPQFAWAGVFSEGVAVVKSEDKFGIINKEGRWVVEPKFEATLGVFENGRLGVKEAGKWGFIDTRGAWIIKPKFHQIEPYYKGYAMVADVNGLWGAIDRTGKLIIPMKYDLVVPEDDYLVAYGGIMRFFYLKNGRLLWEDKDDE